MSGDGARSAPLTLLGFAPMIDSELSRLVLGHYGIPYVEQDHVFGWVSLLTCLHGGYGQVPLLYGRGLHLSGPRAMVDNFDAGAASRLIPLEQPARQKVEADWTRYNGEMATDVAAIAYFYLLAEREMMIRIFSRNIPSGEATLLPSFYGALKGLFTALLSLSEGHAQDALRRVQIRFDLTDRRLADGRPWLGGDRLTLADLALISAAAPLLLPSGYGAPMPSYQAMPEAMQTIITDLRQTATAKLVERFYAARERVNAGAAPITG